MKNISANASQATHKNRINYKIDVIKYRQNPHKYLQQKYNAK